MAPPYSPVRPRSLSPHDEVDIPAWALRLPRLGTPYKVATVVTALFMKSKDPQELHTDGLQRALPGTVNGGREFCFENKV